MKNFLLSVLFLLPLVSLAGKTIRQADDTTSLHQDTCQTETTPEFPGGREGLVKFLQKNIRIPAEAEEKSIKGKVYLKFLVHTDGTISDIQVYKGIPDCQECDIEAMRIVSIMPKWIPAKCDDIPIEFWFTLPMIFNVQ